MLSNRTFHPLGAGALALSLGLVLGNGACVTSEGDRGPGICPAGETCSDLTPEGLSFTITAPSDWLATEFPAVAVGGVASVGFTVDGAYALPDFSIDAPANFTVTNPVRTGNTGSSSVTADSAGSGKFRVLAQDESGLLDRHDLAAVAAASIELHPWTLGVLLDAYAGEWMYSGDLSSLTMMAAIFDSSGNRLVDESIEFTANATPSGTSRWDLIPFNVSENPEVTVTATQNGTISGTRTVTAATSIDGIMVSGGTRNGVDIVDENLACFVPTSGGVPVFGLGMDYQYDGGTTQSLAFNNPCIDTSTAGEEGVTVRVIVPFTAVTQDFIVTGTGEVSPAAALVVGEEPFVRSRGER